jgi:hypothetical protein
MEIFAKQCLLDFVWLALPFLGMVAFRRFRLGATEFAAHRRFKVQKRSQPPRCASAIQIVRPRESIAEAQPQLQPGFAEIIGDFFPVPFHCALILLRSYSTRQQRNDK